MKSHFLKENDVVLSSRWQFQDGTCNIKATVNIKDLILLLILTHLENRELTTSQADALLSWCLH